MTPRSALLHALEGVYRLQGWLPRRQADQSAAGAVNLFRRIAGLARTGWLIVGLTLLLGFLLEGLYRIQGAIRGSLVAGHTAVHPNAGAPWWSEWEKREGAVNGPSRFDPYRAWWAAPYNSPFIHVDSLGRRVTLPNTPGGTRILFLGGSVMWGYTVPDSLTIPSLVSRQLNARGVSGVEIVNLAQPSYNMTQGVISLVLALRSGERFDAVISLDGNNDVLVSLSEGQAGAAFGQVDLARRSAVGLRGFGASLAGLLRYSALANRLARSGGGSLGANSGNAGPGCDTVATYYVNLVHTVEALGQNYKFVPLLFWQPHWATTRKPLEAWERTIKADPAFPALMRSCTLAVERRLATDRSGFIPLTSLFDQDSVAIFLDQYGHMTPVGHERVAQVIADRLVLALAQAKGRAGE